MSLRYAVLGPLRVTADGRPLNLGGRKLRTLLAVLACNANEVVASERLVEAVWDDKPPRTATQNLRVYVHHLRRTLGGDRRIAWQPPGYRLVVEDGGLDSDMFEELARRGRQALADAPDQAAALLRQALKLWRGPALADLQDVRSLRATTARLEERRLATIETSFAAELALGLHADLVGEISGLAAEYPLREHLKAQLMLALYRSGRRAEALTVYRKTRQILVDELGVEPGVELQRLHQAILADDEVSACTLLTSPAQEGAEVYTAPEARPDELHEIRAALRLINLRLDRLEAGEELSYRRPGSDGGT